MKTVLPALLTLALAGGALAAPPEITNVRAEQRADTKLVDIWYDAADADGDLLKIRIEVSDNDGIHGPESARSQVYEIKVPTADELDSLLEQSSSDVRQSAENQMSELQRLQEEINEMMRKLVDKKELGWQEKKELEQIAEKQKQVRQMMQQMQQQIQENNRLEQKYRQ